MVSQINAPRWSGVWSDLLYVVYDHALRRDLARSKWSLGIDTFVETVTHRVCLLKWHAGAGVGVLVRFGL